MHYYTTDVGLVVEDEEGTAYDLSALFDSFEGFVRHARASHGGLDDAAQAHINTAGAEPQTSTVDLAELTLDAPLYAEEVWAAGVTYRISEEARTAESDTPEMYIRVYDADRPELFFKATPSRTVGPDDAVGIRGDSDWDVPEPELAVVLHDGEIVGYTIVNDMSSREIEGQNPLYLPQAKTYDRCCSVGPAVASTGTIDAPRDLEMSIEIERDDAVVFEDATSTEELVRSPEELVGYWRRHNAVPEFCVLLTGTSLVPPDEFTLQEDDHVRIDLEGVGRLENPVTVV